MKLFLAIALFACNAAAQTQHSALLTWSAVTACVDGSPCVASSYNVYKVNWYCAQSTTPPTVTPLPSSTPPVVIASVPSSGNSTYQYTDTQIITNPPTVYCYFITAVNANGESPHSNFAQVGPAFPATAQPNNFTAAPRGQGGRWSASWNYDCTNYAAPVSFEVGLYSNGTYTPIATMSVKTCTGNQAFSDSGNSKLVNSSSIFTVRGFNANQAPGPAAFYPPQ